MYWKRHQLKPDSIIDIANSTYTGGYVKDGTSEEIEKVHNSGFVRATADGDISHEGRSITRDVIYNEGVIRILYNPVIGEKFFEITR